MALSTLEAIRRAEFAMMGTVVAIKAGYNCTQAMSTDKEAAKRVMIYYAAPKPETRGYFSCTAENAREQWFKSLLDGYVRDSRKLIWC